MTEDLQKLLQKLGLSLSEIRVYLHLLDNPGTQIIDVSKSTQLPRSTVKYNIDKLVKLGFANISIKNKTKLYAAANPAMISGQVQRELEKYRNLEQMADKVVPEMVNQYKGNSSINSETRTLDSARQIEGIINGAFKSNELAIVGNVSNFLENFGKQHRKLVDDYSQKDKLVYLFCQKSEVSRLKRQYRGLDTLKITVLANDMESTMYLYTDRVLIVYYRPVLYGIFIKDQGLYSILRTYLK